MFYPIESCFFSLALVDSHGDLRGSAELRK